jgi:hypothetical protein
MTVRPSGETAGALDLAQPAWTPEGRLVVTLAQGRKRSDPTTGENWIQQSAVELLDLRHRLVRRPDLTPYSGGDRLAALPVVRSRLGQRSGAANHRTKIFRVYRFAPDHKLINLEAANA